MTAHAIPVAPAYHDQTYLLEAAHTLRMASRDLDSGDIQGFLLSLKRASFLVGIHPGGHTPSETRVMHAVNVLALEASERLRVVGGKRTVRRG